MELVPFQVWIARGALWMFSSQQLTPGLSFTCPDSWRSFIQNWQCRCSQVCWVFSSKYFPSRKCENFLENLKWDKCQRTKFSLKFFIFQKFVTVFKPPDHRSLSVSCITCCRGSTTWSWLIPMSVPNVRFGLILSRVEVAKDGALRRRRRWSPTISSTSRSRWSWRRMFRVSIVVKI